MSSVSLGNFSSTTEQGETAKLDDWQMSDFSDIFLSPCHSFMPVAQPLLELLGGEVVKYLSVQRGSMLKVCVSIVFGS